MYKEKTIIDKVKTKLFFIKLDKTLKCIAF